MTTTKPAGTGRQGRTKDLRDIRQRGRTYQVRVFVGRDPATGQQLFLTGTAATEKEAIKLRNQYRAEVAAGKAANTRATLAHLLREWRTMSAPGVRATYQRSGCNAALAHLTTPSTKYTTQSASTPASTAPPTPPVTSVCETPVAAITAVPTPARIMNAPPSVAATAKRRRRPKTTA